MSDFTEVSEVKQLISDLRTENAELKRQVAEWKEIASLEQTKWGEACEDAVKSESRANELEAGAAAMLQIIELAEETLGHDSIDGSHYLVENAADKLCNALENFRCTSTTASRDLLDRVEKAEAERAQYKARCETMRKVHGQIKRLQVTRIKRGKMYTIGYKTAIEDVLELYAALSAYKEVR